MEHNSCISEPKLCKKVEEMLKNEGFLVRLGNFSEGDGEKIYEIQALDHEAKDAHDFILENGIR